MDPECLQAETWGAVRQKEHLAFFSPPTFSTWQPSGLRPKTSDYGKTQAAVSICGPLSATKLSWPATACCNIPLTESMRKLLADCHKPCNDIHDLFVLSQTICQFLFVLILFSSDRSLRVKPSLRWVHIFNILSLTTCRILEFTQRALWLSYWIRETVCR